MIDGSDACGSTEISSLEAKGHTDGLRRTPPAIHGDGGAPLHVLRRWRHRISAGRRDRPHDPARGHLPEVKLIGNGPKPGEWFCHGCESFFDTWTPCSPGEEGQTDGGSRPRSPFVRFDFPPGASPNEVAEAINAMRAKHRAQKEEKDEP